MNKQEIKEKEKQYAAAYGRIPSQAAEFEEWETEQVWSEDEEREPEEAIQQPATLGEGKKTIEEALEKAADIRQKLEGRPHSDSSQLIAKDRQR